MKRKVNFCRELLNFDFLPVEVQIDQFCILEMLFERNAFHIY